MVLDNRIIDGHGTKNKAKVGPEGELNVTVHAHPPTVEDVLMLPFRSYFRNSADSLDMRVNGSTTNVDFSIEADPEKDTYIKSISVVISDQNATLDKFGTLTALTNGVVFEWSTIDNGTVTIHEGLKSNFNFVRLAGGQPAFGDDATAFRAGNVAGNSEGYIPFIDLSIIFGLPWGLKLRKGSKDRLTWRVRDNVTGVDAFNIIGYGTQI